VRDTIFISAAPGTAWPLSITAVERLLESRFPDAQFFRKHAPVSGKDYVDFEVTLAGESRIGSYFDQGRLILRDGEPALWADTIVWFLRHLPRETPTVAMVEVNPEVVPIPPGADADTVREMLDSLMLAE
jgi:hypothetical protein